MSEREVGNASPPSPVPHLEELDDFWTRHDREGRRSGHLVAWCQRCQTLSLMRYSPASVPWPRCKVCLPPPSPRLIAVSDPAACRKHPGKPRTKRELIEDGWLRCSECGGWHPGPAAA